MPSAISFALIQNNVRDEEQIWKWECRGVYENEKAKKKKIETI